MGQAQVRFGAKVSPLNFAPKAKDESNKLRRKNSLYDEIVDYLNHFDEDGGVQELVDEALLKSLSEKDKKDIVDDPRVAGLNKLADEVREGNNRSLRNQVTNHFKAINRRFQGRHSLDSLLHISSREGYLSMVNIIFDDTTRIPADREVPIEVNAKNQRGRSPLHVSFAPPTRSHNGLKFGLEADGKKAKAPRPEGITIDSDWVRPGDIKTRRKICKKLITEGADYESRDVMDFVPLHYAAVWGWEDCVEVMIAMDADLAPITSTGMTPLMMACSRGHLKVCKLLLAEADGESADLEASDAQGDTALMYAIRRGNYLVVQLLVETYGADVNVENYSKGKPLMAACTRNDLDMVNLLLDFGVERDQASFELLRGQVAIAIRLRLEMEAGESEDAVGKAAKVRGSGKGAWVAYKERKPGGKKHKAGTREPVFYYNTVTRVSVRKKPDDYKMDMLHIPQKAMFGMHFYH
mmetsp:Transcript_67633/g.136187  ORF Transcript_67633/g.136187 Transcript_67633/m.136187 type:complete len:466 (-) Transcript_67633:75-1472(-)